MSIGLGFTAFVPGVETQGIVRTWWTDVDVVVKRGQAGAWERLPMLLDEETGSHAFLLFDLDDLTG